MKRGLTLIEILVAAIILVLITSSAAVTFVSIKRLSQRISYRYTALNLARDVLEFGEATLYPEGFSLTYSYDSDLDEYTLTDWRNFDPDEDAHPFEYVRDIERRGMVPKGAPHSVVIYYDVVSDPFYGKNFMQTVRVTWRENPTDPEQRLVLGVLPITHVNDQLRLTVNEFWWD